MPNLQVWNLVARARSGARPLADAESCRWLWVQLARGFPNALACVLMENHLHLVTAELDGAAPRARLATSLRAFSRLRSFRGGWEPVPESQAVPDTRHLQRLIRYVLLNPCRAGLVSDPLAWRWSTLRDNLGFVAFPWVSASSLAGALGWSRIDFGARWGRYIKADDHVAPSAREIPSFPPLPGAAALLSTRATRPPVPGRSWTRSTGAPRPTASAIRPEPDLSFSWDALADSCAAALRVDRDSICRRHLARTLFFHFASRCGHQNGAELGRYASADPSTAHHAWKRRVPESALLAAWRCLHALPRNPRHPNSRFT